MDFGWRAEQREVYERMRALGAEADATVADGRMAILCRGGVLGLAVDAEYGGGGLDLVTTALAYEGLGAGLRDGGVLLAAGAHLFGVALTIARVGTPEQRRAWLPRLATGEVMATIAATEADAGSHMAAVEARVHHLEGGFRLTGEKRFVTWADRAGLFLTLARDDGKEHGLTTLLVPPGPGVVCGALLETAGLRGARVAPVRFACEVGAEALLGREGAGLAVFQVAMTFERALILAFRIGAMERALEEAVRFARERRPGGQSIGRHDAVAHRLARMKQRLEASRLLVYRAAWELDQGHRAQSEAALAKWQLADAALASALDAVALRGGVGYLEDGGLPSAVDDALGGTIHSGTPDVLATIVARWLGV
ncbi:acyl-CoA dehydrogenase family protein [Chondromyces crocatus]|uniref:Acyl-CoA dehydrogenase n=1 Tax=Chondromyces crocatus TaxID=52 RepID=A0A0K1E951_CHOCO|nr:acyl-CoA dehydrogenase family protein [Chondromyces crocatus]AKT37202.1 acyl-CoA dehydrogenase [Chondromyces crocatus]